MNYEETVAYLLGIPKFSKKNQPEHTRELMRRLGNPQESFQVIHVAGSNGKGSVCAFLESVLIKSNVTVGMFTSPHLVDIRERFRINGALCRQDEFCEAERIVHRTVEEMMGDGFPHPSFFEYLYAMGMVLFARAGVTCAVTETGLGGRLDATNVVAHPALTVITSISLEHTEILGNTIEEIAAEKAGIIKYGVPVIYDANEPKAAKVIETVAGQQHARAIGIRRKDIKISLNEGKTVAFSIGRRYAVSSVKTGFLAEYQAENGALALVAANELRGILPITEEGIRDGFLLARWPGRMEEAAEGVYLDGGHNVSGIRELIRTVQRMTDMPSLLLFSMVREKDYGEAARLLTESGCFEKVILTEISGNPRALSIEELSSCFAGKLPVVTRKEPADVLHYAMAQRKPGQKLFCTGSLYLVGQLMQAFREREEQGEPDD